MSDSIKALLYVVVAVVILLAVRQLGGDATAITSWLQNLFSGGIKVNVGTPFGGGGGLFNFGDPVATIDPTTGLPNDPKTGKPFFNPGLQATTADVIQSTF